MNILVVDDERVQVESICRGLRRNGYRVTQAYNGDEALRKIKDETVGIDIVITDYSMPGMNGLDLLKKIRKTHRFLPVIMMTAYGEKELVIEALKNRCDNFIEKPFTLDQLLTETVRAVKSAPPNGEDARFSKRIPQHLHQINNPLMSIIGSAELALKANDSQAVQRSIRRILDAAIKISEINRKMMHGDAEAAGPAVEVDIGMLLDRCLEMFNDLLVLKGITLTKEYGHRAVKVSGNQFDLEQMLKNLILNAIEAMEESTRKVLKIQTFLESYAGRIVIHVHDSGCGIPEEKLPTLFMPYFTSKPKGTGLGLPVVKRIVEKHGGNINVKTRVGEGTVFTIKLPSPEEAEKQPEPRKSSATGLSPKSQIPSTKFQGERNLSPVHNSQLTIDNSQFFELKHRNEL